MTVAFLKMLNISILCCGVMMCFLADPQSCSHSYAIQINAAATCTHRGLETLTCRECEHSYMAYTDICPHNFGDTTVVQVSNCTEEGQSSASCVDCGATALQAIPKNTDAHNMVQTQWTESTCMQAGVQVFTCTRCEHQERIELPQKEHKYEQKILLRATCIKQGRAENRCTECGDTHTVTTPKGGTQLGPLVRRCLHLQIMF